MRVGIILSVFQKHVIFIFTDFLESHIQCFWNTDRLTPLPTYSNLKINFFSITSSGSLTFIYTFSQGRIYKYKWPWITSLYVFFWRWCNQQYRYNIGSSWKIVVPCCVCNIVPRIFLIVMCCVIYFLVPFCVILYCAGIFQGPLTRMIELMVENCA